MRRQDPLRIHPCVDPRNAIPPPRNRSRGRSEQHTERSAILATKSMDKCRFCGKEATIYVEGKPTCLDCTQMVLKAPSTTTTPRPTAKKRNS